MLKDVAPIDRLFFIGDAIEGKGEMSGGTELITSDRVEQVSMAVECINQVRLNASKDFKACGVFGTARHVGREEDWEQNFFEDAGFEKYGSHEWPNVEGVVFDLKHKVGSSQIPHGRATAVLRDMLWNDMWTLEDGSQPNAEWVIRGHVHYYMHVDTFRKKGLTCPALQGMGSKFGARECSGIVHWGMCIIDVEKGETISFMPLVRYIDAQKAVETVL
jgi:hypothetical protein